MGVVYSVAEVGEGRVPTVEAHLDAAEKLLGEASCMPNVTLAMVHGSVPLGRHTTRSDLDVVICYEADEPTDEIHYPQSIAEFLDDIDGIFNIKTERNIWPTYEPEAARRARLRDVLFNQHLARSYRQSDWIVGKFDPMTLDILEEAPDSVKAREHVLSYLMGKHNKFTAAPAHFSGSDTELHILQRAFEVPKNVVNKVRQLGGIWYGDPLNSPLMSVVQQDETLHAAIGALQTLDGFYTTTLENVSSDGLPTDDEVNDYLEWLIDAYPTAVGVGRLAVMQLARHVGLMTAA